MNMNINPKYGSRKFLVTTLVILCTTGLAAVAMMNAHVALVFAAAIGSYNFVNGWVEKK